MTTRALRRIGALAACMLLALPAAAMANVPVTRISSDPFANTTSQHATEVEPDTFSNGSTIVSAFQVGRFFNGGATDIGWSRPPPGAAPLRPGFPPGPPATTG